MLMESSLINNIILFQKSTDKIVRRKAHMCIQSICKSEKIAEGLVELGCVQILQHVQQSSQGSKIREY